MRSRHSKRAGLTLLTLLAISSIHSTLATGAAEPVDHAQAIANDDEQSLDLLHRYGLDRRHLRAFQLLNGISQSWQPLRAGTTYHLPIIEVLYDVRSIRTSLHIPMTEAIDIRGYNARLAGANLKPPVTDDHRIWVPYDHVLARAGGGQTGSGLLRRFGLDDTHATAFTRLNDLGGADMPLTSGALYRLPIHIHNYAGPSIRAALGVTDHDARAIQAYNHQLHARGLKPQPWDDHVVWAPYHLQDNADYGPIYRQFEVTSDQLRNCVFYLSPGHGGPDPGTLGVREGESICEDEYTLDITLRLARELQRHGARVEVMVEDEGIRDMKFLPCDSDERFQDGMSIARVESDNRLAHRVDQVNGVYATRERQNIHQRFLAIHIDFRQEASKHIDFNLYHHRSSDAGRQLAAFLHDTIERRYDSRLGGRQFVGEIIAGEGHTDFYVVRETHMPAVLIELANINNELDQLRFIVIDSRQKIAGWLCEGLIADFVDATRERSGS